MSGVVIPDPRGGHVWIYGVDGSGNPVKVLVDVDGHPQVDILTSALPSGASTEDKQDDIITELQTMSSGLYAPIGAQFVVLALDGSLTNESLHSGLSGGDLHEPKAHKASHENGGGDEISLAGLAGAVTTITFIIDGGGSAITTGEKGHLEIPFGCTINQVTMLADQSGSIVVDIWKDTYANFPPTDADSITASAPPTIATAQKSQDSTLTGWTTSIAASDILAFNVDSITTVTRVTISLEVTKS